MIDLIVGILVLIGAGFCLIAAIGLVRFPDLYLRMHAATKAGTLGAGLTMLGVAAFGMGDGDLGTVLRAIAVILFLFLTAPIGAHLLARSAYATGLQMWQKTEHDDLAGRYDFESEVLAGDPAARGRADQDA